MRITPIQSDIIWEKPAKNRDHFSHLIQQSAATDLIVLPEMFTSGFSMNTTQLGETMDGPTAQWMQRLAQEKDAAIMGSLIIQEDSTYVNRLLFVQPSGKIQYYDKRHLFGLGGEDRAFAAGKKKLLVKWRDWTICPQICYDLRFPVFSRNTEGYDLLIYIASWPSRRRTAWQQLLIARAIENQAWCLGVNRIGKDIQEVDHAGDSALIDYAGEVQWKATYQSCAPTLKLDKKAMEVFREKLPFLKDKDSFTIDGL